MKTRIIFLVLISIIFGSCKEKNPKVFNEDLLKAILEAKDSLNIKDDELLSIQFYNQDRYERRCMMKVFSLNYYASGEISAFTKIGNTTVAIYNQ